MGVYLQILITKCKDYNMQQKTCTYIQRKTRFFRDFFYGGRNFSRKHSKSLDDFKNHHRFELYLLCLNFQKLNFSCGLEYLRDLINIFQSIFKFLENISSKNSLCELHVY